MAWLAGVFLLACQAGDVWSPSPDLRTAPAVTVEVGLGQTTRFHDVEVAFTAVPEDSRCPVDVICVRAGNAVVEIGVTPAFGEGPSHRLVLNTTEGAHDGVAWDVRVTLLQLLPDPVSTRVTPAQDYVAKLSLEGECAGVSCPPGS
jgi:hypothetical protein